ncbi:uncharacterized protein LOC133806111 [Humulus lupulus]|uniref:uncharacterized protein LOC133806111 n=1 Tax=Humulus lupulus TaxID=3486 RepID=UPI002B411E74|nr:uncharacterized protein LOC133806111 [Humulus lupulus]
MDPYIQCRLASQDSIESFSNMLMNDNGEKKTRGPTQMREIWGKQDEEKIKITYNDFGQPYDKSASKLSSFIGTLVRDGKNAPINYKTWHEVPAKYKLGMWKIIQIEEKFEIPPHAKNWTFRTFGRKLRTWKSYLKKTYYLEHLSFVEQKKYKDKRRKSAKNKTSRAEKKYNHTTSTRKKDGASTPTRATMFKICYSKKDKSITNDKTKEAMLQLQEKEELIEDASKEKSMNDVFSKVMGKEKHGSVRMYGFGVFPSDVWKDKTWRRNQNEYVDTLQSEVNDLRSQVQILTKTILSKQNNGNDKSTLQAINASALHNKETQRQLWFSSSAYDTPVVEVGEVVNLKSVTSEPETSVIGIVLSRDPSKETIGQVVGAPIAWLTTFVVPRESNTQLGDSML